MSANILPGSLTVTGNLSTATAGIGGNLTVGGNITVTGNLYSANVNVSGGGGGGGVTSITTASGITSSGSTGAITISAVVANVVGISGIGVSSTGGTFTVGISGAISNASATSNSIGGVILSNSNISNITRIQDSGGYIDIQAGDCNSRLNSFRFDSSGYSGAGGKIYPTVTGIIQITGDSTGANSLTINNTGALNNDAATSNSIGGVTLSGGAISNITRIRDSGGDIDIQAGACNSTLNSFKFDSTAGGGGIGKIYPKVTGSIQITGDSTGANSLTINNTGALNNDPTTSNSIGGVVLSNGVVTPGNVLANNPGYVRLGPILFQWGYATIGASIPGTVSFPLAHSSAPWSIVFSPANTSAGNQINNTISNVTSSNFQIVTSLDALNAYWQSIGPA